jgi:trimeric autotransporter adhesin
MAIRRSVSIALSAAILLSASVARAQQQDEAGTQPRAASASAAPAVTASVAGGRVRVASPDQAALRLELYAETGQSVSDTDFRPGSLLDWRPGDGGQTVPDGSYLLVVTTRDLQGRLRQRLGRLTLEGGRVSLARVTEEKLSAAQGEGLAAGRAARGVKFAGPAASLNVLAEGETPAVAVAAHDGETGQLTSTRGGLSLRTGDVFKGEETERVRVTEDGRVGIGTSKPEAALDVAGAIRARGGIVFDDGTVLKSAASRGAGGVALVSTTAAGDGGASTNATGTGTTGALAKWTDNVGTLGDSIITESGDKVAFGSTPLTYKLNVGSATNGPDGVVVRNTGGTAAVSQLRLEMKEASDVLAGFDIYSRQHSIADRRGEAIFWTFGSPAFTIAAQDANSYFRVITGGSNFTANERLRITPTGNVGIGTAAPTQKLEVAGSIKITGVGNAIYFPDGTAMTTAASGGGGGSMSGTSIVNAVNDPSTAGVFSDARLSPNVARLGGANFWSGANVFGAGLSANNALVTNVGNPVNAGDAVNKAYADANFVKFVPGAEQLSVGDANGTATMINLRGGSTCCSGPGGHTPAWFKVFQNGSFVFTGNLGIGTSPMEGKGYRTSWNAERGAFRSGYADNEWDQANTGYFSWAGGSNSTAIGLYALAFGDTNSAESTSSIVFGSGNQVKGAAGFSAGAGNRVCDTYGVALGNNAKSGGPLINGRCDPDTFNIRGLAAVAIGYNVTADQDHTTAMGKFASNNGFTGTFIWSDGAPQASADTFRNTANNEFAVRATGGVRFRTNLGGTTGCNLPGGSGVFSCTSSRSTKENFSLVDGNDVLSKLRKVPVSTWNYITEGQQIRHLGPMAEDFHSAFRLGTDDKSIGVLDIAGVSLAAVKALDARTSELQTKTEELQRKTAEVEQLRQQVTTLEQRLAALEEAIRGKDQK